MVASAGCSQDVTGSVDRRPAVSARDARLLDLLLRLGREDPVALEALELFLSRIVHDS